MTRLATRESAWGLPISLRRAGTEDLADLHLLEQRAFSADRISTRSWRRLVASASATVTLAQNAQGLAGASVLLHSARSSVARLYSLAVDPSARC